MTVQFWTFANFSLIATILLLKSEPGLSYFIISFVNASDFREVSPRFDIISSRSAERYSVFGRLVSSFVPRMINENVN